MAGSASPRGWARCLDNVADVLRRGAWYPIVDETADGKVVLEVRKKPVRISRIDVAVRDTPPDRWSIVVRTGLLRPTLGGREGDSFAEYMVPHASLRLKQGFGRLIRSSADRGVVLIADSRIVSKAYGEVLLEALPPAKRVIAPLAEVVKEVR